MPDFELPYPSAHAQARAFVNRKEVPCTVNGNIITLDIPPNAEKQEENVLSRKFDIPKDAQVMTISKKDGTPGVF